MKAHPANGCHLAPFQLPDQKSGCFAERRRERARARARARARTGPSPAPPPPRAMVRSCRESGRERLAYPDIACVVIFPPRWSWSGVALATFLTEWERGRFCLLSSKWQATAVDQRCLRLSVVSFVFIPRFNGMAAQYRSHPRLITPACPITML